MILITQSPRIVRGFCMVWEKESDLRNGVPSAYASTGLHIHKLRNVPDGDTLWQSIMKYGDCSRLSSR